jgi:hypothetical protein
MKTPHQEDIDAFNPYSNIQGKQFANIAENDEEDQQLIGAWGNEDETPKNPPSVYGSFVKGGKVVQAKVHNRFSKNPPQINGASDGS